MPGHIEKPLARNQVLFWKTTAQRLVEAERFSRADVDRIPANELTRLRAVIHSRNEAAWRIGCKMMRYKESATGRISFGSVRLDEKVFAMRHARKWGSSSDPGTHQIFCEAAANGDDAFLRDFGKRDKSTKARQIDWAKPEGVEQLLVALWCGHGFRPKGFADDFPPLCLFTDQARGDLFGFSLDAIRKIRVRLKLEQIKPAMIKTVSVKAGFLHLA